MSFRHAYLVILLILSTFAYSQAQKKPQIWQLSGLVVNNATKEPIPYARLRVNHSMRGILANPEGFYSIPVIASDTVYFYALGYKPSYLVIQDYLDAYLGDKESDYLYAINYMREDSIIIPGVTIFPYNTPGALRTAIVEAGSMKPLEERFAEQNLDPEVMDVLSETMPVDGGERLMAGRLLYEGQYAQKNVAKTIPLIDPIAMYRFLQYINDMTKQKRIEDLNYWEE